MRKVFLLLLIAALVIPFAAPAEGNGVITSGDFSYKLDKYRFDAEAIAKEADAARQQAEQKED